MGTGLQARDEFGADAQIREKDSLPNDTARNLKELMMFLSHFINTEK